MFTWKKPQATYTDTKFRAKPKPNNKACRRSLEEDFCPIILLECIIPCMGLVEQSASPAGFLRNQRKMYREQFASRRISTREPLVSDLFLWEKLHAEGGWSSAAATHGVCLDALGAVPHCPPELFNRAETWGGHWKASDGASLGVQLSHSQLTSEARHQQQCCLCFSYLYTG